MIIADTGNKPKIIEGHDYCFGDFAVDRTECRFYFILGSIPRNDGTSIDYYNTRSKACCSGNLSSNRIKK